MKYFKMENKFHNITWHLLWQSKNYVQFLFIFRFILLNYNINLKITKINAKHQRQEGWYLVKSRKKIKDKYWNSMTSMIINNNDIVISTWNVMKFPESLQEEKIIILGKLLSGWRIKKLELKPNLPTVSAPKNVWIMKRNLSSKR
jgi:hypothetical protein